MISRRFALFVLAGGLAAGVNFGSRILLSRVMPYVPAIAAAYCLGMLTAFVLNRLFVFRTTSNALPSQVGWFMLVNAAALAQTVLISLLLARWLFPAIDFDFHPETMAHALGVAVPVITSYLGHKKFTFRNHQHD
ncbi:MAG TPA: hypothetical protein DDZ67_00800 [Xanthomonadaceae bacterium]|nr:hypothetical protein [Xanthomonadaceae bacterium]